MQILYSKLNAITTLLNSTASKLYEFTTDLSIILRTMNFNGREDFSINLDDQTYLDLADTIFKHSLNETPEGKDILHIDISQSVDDWLDTFSQDPSEVYAKFVIDHLRMPAWKIQAYAQYTSQFKLYCKYKGKQYVVTMASRMGDIGLSEDLNATSGYNIRVLATSCTAWSPFPLNE